MSRSSIPARRPPPPKRQIEVINSLIAQNVNAIAVSANDTDALVPALKKAMSAASP